MADDDKKQSSVAMQVFLGLFLFFVVLPIATCMGCTTCVAVTGSTASHSATKAPAR